MLFFSVAFIGLLGLSGASPFKRRQTTPPPVSDPFYTVPANISSYPLGAVINTRNVTNPVSQFFGDRINIKESYDVLYRTSDTFGNATATVTTILLPDNADLTKLVSYQVAEDASYLNCAPSYAIQGGGSNSSETEILLIEIALTQGWPVAVPDHEGPKSSYLANINSAHAILDGLRAVTSKDSPVPIPSSAIKVLWGYSGGSITSGVAAERQPSYAPELEIAGAAIGGTVPNITNVVTAVNKGYFAGLIVAGVLGLTHEYPSIDALVKRELKPETAETFRYGERACLGDVSNKFEFQDIFSYFYNGDVVYTDPNAIQVLYDNALGKHDAPKIPLLVYKSVGDEISPVEDTDEMVKSYCAGGTDVEYHRDHLSEHVTAAITGAPLAYSWIKDRMEGIPITKGCSTHDELSNLLTPGGLEGVPDFLIEILLDAANAPEKGAVPHFP